jgi:hypothetical protein
MKYSLRSMMIVTMLGLLVACPNRGAPASTLEKE